MKLNFVGTGAAFNLEKRETSAFIMDGSNMILIDCGSTVYSDGYITGVIEDNNVYNICILITHTHPDHVGGLGAFIMWLYYNKHVTPTICYGNRFGNETALRNFLSIQGVNGGMYNWLQLCSKTATEICGRYLVKAVRTNHIAAIESCGYIITDKKDTCNIFYSGDLNEVPSLNYSEFDEIYIEVTSNPVFTMHLSLNLLEKTLGVFRHKINIIHYEEEDVSNIIDAGFKIVKNVWERDGIYELND